MPNQITLYAAPYELRNDIDNDLGSLRPGPVDAEPLHRLGWRCGYDTVQTSFPEQRIGPGPLVPTRNLVFPGKDNLDYNDITYRSGFT